MNLMIIECSKALVKHYKTLRGEGAGGGGIFFEYNIFGGKILNMYLHNNIMKKKFRSKIFFGDFFSKYFPNKNQSN